MNMENHWIVLNADNVNVYVHKNFQSSAILRKYLKSLNKFIAKRNNVIFYCSNDIGVKPILSKLNENINFYQGAEIEDTIVGKAAACLYVLARIKFVYAHTLSEAAKKYLEQNNIPFQCDELVKEIRNRTDTDMCPLEKSVMDIDDPILAKKALEKTIENLMKKQAKSSK